MAKKKKQNKETRRLLNGWVFDMAYLLMDECMEQRADAMRQAHLVRKLLGRLGEGVVEFEYYRGDGTLRRARGTLRHGISEAYDHYEYKATLTPTVHADGLHFTYWDLDREQFRSFASNRVARIVK